MLKHRNYLLEIPNFDVLACFSSFCIVRCVAGWNHIFALNRNVKLVFFFTTLILLVQDRKSSWLKHLNFCCLRFKSPKFAGSTPQYLSDSRPDCVDRNIFLLDKSTSLLIEVPHFVCGWTPHFKRKAQSMGCLGSTPAAVSDVFQSIRRYLHAADADNDYL